MADSKISELTALTSPASDDVLAIVDTDAGVTKKITVSNLQSSSFQFVLEDGDGTEVTINNNNEVKFVEGGGIDINWTDTDNGSDADPYDLTFSIDSTVATLTGSQTLTNKTLTSPVLNTGVSGTAVKDEDNMASDSATHLATQQSIKAYVDSTVAATNELVEDSSPQLGGDLDLNSNNITGTGNINITGGLTATSASTITVADNSDNLTLTTTDADANSGPNLRLYRNSGSPADSDLIGNVQFEGRNDNSQDVVYGEISARANDVSDGTEDGLLFIKAMTGGTLTEYMRFDSGSGGIVVNDGSADMNFRVESNGNANMLFVDGGNDKVGIGTSSPASNLHIVSGGSTGTLNSDADELVVQGTRGGLSILSNNGEANTIAFGDVSDADVGKLIYDHSANAMTFTTNTSERMRIDSSGLVGIGTTSPSSYNDYANNLVVYENGNAGITIAAGTSNNSSLYFADGTSGDSEYRGWVDYLHASDALRLATAASERLRIDSSGNVGIGTSSPTNALSVEKSITGDFVAEFKQGHSTAGNSYGVKIEGGTNASDTAFLVANQGGTNMFEIQGDGKVGIGTTSPTRFVQLKDTSADMYIGLEGGTSNTVGILFGDTDDHTQSRIQHANSDNSLRFSTVQSERMRIDSSGNVKITNDDNVYLSIDSTQTNGDEWHIFNAVSGSTSQLQFKNIDQSKVVMLLDEAGKVGIGTSSPLDMLHVLGSSSTLDIGTDGSAEIVAQFNADSTANRSGRLKIAGTNIPSNHSVAFISDSSSDVGFSFNVRGSSRAEAMVITGDGNVALGTTDVIQDFGDGRTSLALKGTGSEDYATVQLANNGTSSNDQILGLLSFYDGGNHNARIDTIRASNTVDAHMRFWTAPSGGGIIERMRIGSEGHVGIGTSTTSNKLRILQDQSDENCVQIEYDTSSADESVMRWLCDRSANAAWDFLQAYSNNASSADLEFQMSSGGNMSADGSFTGSGADYAEYFETADGNAIAIGKTVVLDGNKVRASTSSDDTSAIIGVVRPKEDGKCSMTIGNTAWNHWTDKYLTDDFGVFIWEDYTVKEWTENIDNEDGSVTTKNHSYPFDAIPEGVTVPDDAKEITQQRKKQNPDWNEETEYVKRQDRDEWVIVGLLGQIPINKNEKTGTNWIKMRDISDSVQEWLVR